MQHTFSSSLLLSLILAGSMACAACGSTRAAEPAKAPATTGAELASGSDPAATNAAEPAPAAEKESEPPPPPGRLVCRTKNAVDGTTELYLEWEGKEAKGTLRQITQSGMVHNERVNAQRDGGIILVDDTHGADDLVTHTAVLQQSGGTLSMRLGRGTSGAWVKCD